MKKKTYLGKAIALFAVVAVVIALVVSCSQPTNSGGGGAISGGSDTTGGNGTTGGKNAQITINLPPIGSTAIRSLTDAQVSRLQRETAKYRVIFSGLGQTIPRDGDGTTFSAVFPVGAQVSVTVYCLNKNDEVIVKTVTKTVTISSGTNSLSFKLSEDGEEIIPERDDGGSGGDEKPDDTDKEPEEEDGDDTPSGGDSGNNPPAPTGNVKYDGGTGASNVPSDTVTHSPGSEVILKTDEPTRTGFTFAGWTANKELKYINPTNAQEETITQGTVFVSTSSQTVGNNTKITSFKMPDSPVTLTAQWDINYKTNKADWEVGDIVLQDTGGNIVAVHKDVYNIRDTAYGDGVAVVYKNANNKVYIVGKVHEKNELVWCDSSAAGYNQNFTSLQCEPDNGGTAGNYTFTGKQASGEQHTDGSTNWQKLKDELAGNDDTDPPGKYPAWEWVNDYAKTQGLTGDLATGWYLPTFAELFDIWKANRTDGGAIENSLTAAGGDTFGSDTYWSSSLYASSGNRAYDLYFSTGDRLYSTKGMKYYVCAVRQLQY